MARQDKQNLRGLSMPFFQPDACLLRAPKQQAAPVVFSSPHSGSYYPESFLRNSCLDSHAIRSSEDAFVDRLFDAAPRLGAPLLCARYPRAYVDLNRAADELDPDLIAGLPSRHGNTRVASGLGVIPRVVARGRLIYEYKIQMAEAKRRLEMIWHPYHRCLRGLMDETCARFGKALLLDCHSMPHDTVMSHARDRRPEIVLGDRVGTTASAEMMEMTAACFRAEGFSVARNSPFAGVYICKTYGAPARQRHAIQIEIDRSLYMNEKDITPRGNFSAVQQAITAVIRRIIINLQASQALAAE